MVVIQAGAVARQLAKRNATVLNWHIRSHKKSDVCKECGQEYPCRTRLMLLGREREAAETKPMRVIARKT